MPRQTEEQNVLEFARKWEPYGGADASEILLCFGLDVGSFKARLHHTLTRQAVPDLDPDLRWRLLRYAATR
ncbi:hypothetical protein CH272_11685 [Rhodococcus sp. 05-340-1]|uniref:hypothetical protein n=1 Tax=unclassified Rhodococcus (in: high G+C Gram-positive bacteria) TaxID=192944 RepID=UPI000B9B9692|nr:MULTISPECIES: hypothetical protein [unclassified Rhodococcus (in: high G+C Gram-positive bacteria)]OZD62181.1 hypothetical protein CH271_24950 [Rhodococcus sp. 05-340-2]OZD78359.1 hypothetical protein CH272_11685 [Rhodococcus sp. 05-340-1]